MFYSNSKSGNFKGTNGQKYEAVKQAWLLRLKANVLDSLKTTYQELENLEAEYNERLQEVNSIQTNKTNIIDYESLFLSRQFRAWRVIPNISAAIAWFPL